MTTPNQQEKPKVKKSKAGIIMFIIGLFITLVNITSGNSFVDGSTSAGAGYNASVFLIWILGLYLLFKGASKLSKKKNEKV